MPPVPADARVFKFPAMLAPFMFAASLFFIAWGGVVCVVEFNRGPREANPVILCFLPFFVIISGFAYRSSLRFRDSVAVDEEGIWYMARNRAATFMEWQDIATVRTDDTGQRLVLQDASGAKKIRLESQIENFRTLRDFVVGHALSTSKTAKVDTFHRTWINRAILSTFAFICLCMARVGYQNPQTGFPSIFFIVLAALVLLGISQDPLRLHIGEEAVVIVYPGWKRTIPFAQIDDIRLQDVTSRGNVWAAVVINRRQKRPIKLFRFREGSLTLCDALRSAWHDSNANERADRI